MVAQPAIQRRRSKPKPTPTPTSVMSISKRALVSFREGDGGRRPQFRYVLKIPEPVNGDFCIVSFLMRSIGQQDVLSSRWILIVSPSI